MNWTDERVSKLSQHWQSGHTAREIAERLGEDITRNAVIGKAYRLGLAKPSKSSIARRKNKAARIEMAIKLQAPCDLWTTLPKLTALTCRWPVGDPHDLDFHFCGAHSPGHRAYCEFHEAKAHRTMPAVRRAVLDEGAAA